MTVDIEKLKALAARDIKRWQDRAHEMDGPNKRLNLACEEIAELRAEVERLRAAQTNSASKSSSNCVGCEGSPSGDNNPCAVCGYAAPAAGTEKDAAYDVLKSIIEDGYLSDTNTARGHAAIEAHSKARKRSGNNA